MAAPASCSRNRGAALLLVLWLVVLLTAVVGSFALAARVEHLQGYSAARGLVARNAARAGIEYALARVQSHDRDLQWLPDGRPYAWLYQGADVEIRITDVSGKVDLNTAPPSLLTGLLMALQVEQPQRLAGAIVDWRDGDVLAQPGGGAEDPDYAAAGRPHGAKDAPFEAVSELWQVLGIDAVAFAAIAPYVTVHSGLPWPDSQFADVPVLEAMGLDGTAVTELRGSGGPVFGSGTYSIDSLARLADGRRARLRAVLRFGSDASGKVYTALQWEEGSGSR